MLATNTSLNGVDIDNGFVILVLLQLTHDENIGDIKECVTPGSNQTKASAPQTGMVPDTTAFEAWAS